MFVLFIFSVLRVAGRLSPMAVDLVAVPAAHSPPKCRLHRPMDTAEEAGSWLLAPASFGVFVAHATILQVMMCLHFPAFVLALLCLLVWRNKLNGLFIF